MSDHVEAALEELERAADSAGADVRENVYHVQEGLEELAGGDATKEARPEPHRVEELAEKLSGLERETDGDAREPLREARRHVEAFEEEL